MHPLVVVALKGAAMGVAEIIPGVSGGTIALIAGIYDRLVAAIAGLRPAPLRHVPALHRRAHRRALIDELVAMDLPFLVALGLGMATMIVLLARVVEAILESYPGITYAFFTGLILASAFVLGRTVSVRTPRRLALAGGVAALAFVLSGLTTAGLGHELPVVFVAGAIAITALVLPGISGSFLLIALGQYEYMVASLNTTVDGVIGLASGGSEEFVSSLPPVVAFLAGATLGVLTVAHAVSFALERARELTLIVLISLMVGAIRVPAEAVIEAGTTDPSWLLAVVVSFAAGAAVIVVFDRATGELTY